MALFKLNNKDELKEISKNEFKLEKELQIICEENLEKLLGLKFVKSEFSIENYRFDTLAYDEESKSFVIIEYKRGQNYSVVDQGYAYLATMLNNKAEFILEFNENFDEILKRKDIDWSQSKIIFISQNFTKYQRDTINFKDLPIELYEITKFNNGIISFNEIKGKRISSSIKNISIENEIIKKVSSEIKKYTLDDCLSKGGQEIIELYEEFSIKIEEMISDIKIEPKKLYIAFRKNKKNIVDFRLQKKQLKIWLNIKKGEIDDNKNLFRDVSNIGHWGNGDYEGIVTSNNDLEYILSLIKQVNNYYNK